MSEKEKEVTFQWILHNRTRLYDTIQKYGGSFMRGLSEALLRADKANTHKIYDTWREEIEKYSRWTMEDH